MSENEIKKLNHQINECYTQIQHSRKIDDFDKEMELRLKILQLKQNINKLK